VKILRFNENIKKFENSKDITLFAIDKDRKKFVEGTIDVTYQEYYELEKYKLVWYYTKLGYLYDVKDTEKIKKHLELINSEHYKISKKYNL